LASLRALFQTHKLTTLAAAAAPSGRGRRQRTA